MKYLTYIIILLVTYSCRTVKENDELENISQLINANLMNTEAEKGLTYKVEETEEGNLIIKTFQNSSLVYEVTACIKQLDTMGKIEVKDWDYPSIEIKFRQKNIKPGGWIAFYEDNQIKYFNHKENREDRSTNYVSVYIKEDTKMAEEICEKISNRIKAGYKKQRYRDKWSQSK